MTAEVYVCNKTCIALAADSASSIGRDKLKIYNGVEKLFSLSRSFPVGIMIFGAASFLGIPWETIIKEYRKKHGHQSYAKTEEYASAFMSHLELLVQNHVSDDNEKYYIESRLSNLIRLILSVIEQNFPNAFTVENTPDELETQVDTLRTTLIKDPDLVYLHQDKSGGFNVKYKQFVEQTLSQLFEQAKLPQLLTGQVQAKIVNTVLTYYFEKNFLDSTSGIVIAGFGEDEIFPSCYSYRLAGTIEQQVNYWIFEVDKPDGLSRIIPFAQNDMAHSFLMGISNEASANVLSMLNDLTDTFVGNVKDMGFDEENLSELRERTIESTSERYRKFTDEQNEQHPKRIMDMLSHLPKEEMAQLAETLVSLTALKQRITDSDETVGGPIDVAVISKGDGFIWLKRKHYFDSQINHDYTTRTS
jgi:hypothetical protein